MLARAGVGKGVQRAGLLLMLAANAPDVDIVSWFGGSLTYLEYHRWFTHSIAAIPLMAVLAAAITRLFVRGPFPWLWASGAACVGVASHLLLDWTNVYGIRLLLPFSPEWLRLDITPIVDIWIWILFAVAIAAPALARLVSSEIGGKPGTGRGWAVFALLALFVYEGGRYMAHGRAVAMLDGEMYDGSSPVRTAAFATFVNPMMWRGVVETSNSWRVYDVNLAHTFNPAEGEILYKAETSVATVAASRSPVVQQFMSFSSFQLWRTTPVAEPEGGTEVDIYDLRFGDPRQPGFMASAVVNAPGTVGRSSFTFGRPAAR